MNHDVCVLSKPVPVRLPLLFAGMQIMMFTFSHDIRINTQAGLSRINHTADSNSVLGATHNAVVPVGGARLARGRDRIIHFACAAALAVLPQAGVASSPTVSISVPSGQSVSLQEIIDDREAGALRFRFLAPQIASAEAAPAFEAITADLQYLCNEYAIKTLPDAERTDRNIVISLAAEAVEFGVAAPGVIQFFDAFHVENGTCIWEMF